MTETPNPNPSVGHEGPSQQPAYSYSYAPVALAERDRNWAAASHWGTLVAAWLAMGFLAPLLIMLTVGNESPFVRKHAVESLNFQINALVYTVVFGILIIFLIGLVLLPLYGIFYLICVILASVRASHGEEYRYPLTLRFIT